MRFRSKFEKSVASLFRIAGVRFKYEPDRIPYTIQRTYTPDFKVSKGSVFNKTNGDIYVETKGLWTSADRTKMRLVKEQHPHLDIRLWFMVDNWMTKKKKQRYSDWCDKNGFPYHVGETFPKHWFKGKKK